MKDMKNVKPAYAVNLGTGVFMAGTQGWYVCRKCMAQRYNPNGKPDVRNCPKGGLHSWVKNW